jgi:beta-lactamase regulating signal transducer with metallopeptidase domain
MILLSLRWVIACSIQIAALVIFTFLLVRLLHLREPRVRWACFEGILLLCLCLPFLQMRKPQMARGPQMQAPWVADNLRQLPLTGSIAVTQAGFRLDLRLAILWLLVAGIVVRAGWLIVGFRSLDRLRLTARPYSALPKAAEGLMDQLGISPRILISDRISGAITFGLRSSVILFPSRFGAMSDETKVAVLCHELIHVRNRHWLFTAIEECVLVFVWFHPAIWWLISEIQLAREEVVDLNVVRTLRARDQYVDALLEAAQISGRIGLTPATSFVWRGSWPGVSRTYLPKTGFLTGAGMYRWPG